ncbi:MAG: acetyl-CoA carboxylase biotin carboxyl carrier protein, partial [Legionella sp.]|nr:acetyl-CoA carboxylase biotin carboxyl carrier protein [Legionella sp.]
MKKTVKKAAKSAAKATASKAPAPPAKGTPKAAGAKAAADKSIAGLSVEGSLVKQLASILDETSLTEIEYEAGGVRVRVARNHGGGYAAPAMMHAPAAGPAALLAPAAPPAPVDVASNPGTVKSPMVGVCYLLPEPGAPAFVKVGDTVAEGQTLCLIEAMKTFNPVKAPRPGKVTQIIVETGAPVEYGEPLLVI